MSTDLFSDESESSKASTSHDEAGDAQLASSNTEQRRQIGRYILQDRLGSGGTATVYQAFDQVNGQSVALKVLPSSADENTLERFRREAMTSGGLRHPNIVRTIQVGVASQAGDIAYIAMELIEGETLAHLLTKRGRLHPEESCSLLASIASALAYAHDEGIVHRDVKPSNILLKPIPSTNSNTVQLDSIDHPIVPMLSDFGIARALDAPELTASGRTVGTPAYMAPEQCRGGLDIDGRADIYALTAVLFRCLVGRQPFLGNTPQILHAHVYEPLKIEDDIYRRLSPLVVEILQNGMAKKPEERYENAHEMADALATVAGITLADEISTEADVVTEPAPTITLTSVHPIDEPPTISETVIIPASGTVGSTVEPISPPATETDTARTVVPSQSRSQAQSQTRSTIAPPETRETTSSVHIFEQTDADGTAANMRPTFAQRLEQIRWGRLAFASISALLIAAMLAIFFNGNLISRFLGDPPNNAAEPAMTAPTENGDDIQNVGAGASDLDSSGVDSSGGLLSPNQTTSAQNTATAASATATAQISLTLSASTVITTTGITTTGATTTGEVPATAEPVLTRFIPSVDTPTAQPTPNIPPTATSAPLPPPTPLPLAPPTATPTAVPVTPDPTATWTPDPDSVTPLPTETPTPQPTDTPLAPPTPTWTPSGI